MGSLTCWTASLGWPTSDFSHVKPLSEKAISVSRNAAQKAAKVSGLLELMTIVDSLTMRPSVIGAHGCPIAHKVEVNAKTACGIG